MATTTTVTTTISSCPDKLIDFWKQNFGEDKNKQISNAEFEKVLEEFLKKKHDESKEDNPPAYNKDPETRRLFSKSVTTQIFWPEVSSQSQDEEYPAFVDYACIKKATVTFGPWKTLFETIAKNLRDDEQPLAPLQFFHGRANFDETIASRLRDPQSYCLRYNPEGKGIIMSYARKTKDGTIQIRHDEIIRKKFKSGVKWEWIESVAKIGGMKKVPHKFDSVGDFLNHKKGLESSSSKKNKGGKTVQIKDPVMFSSAYKCFSGNKKKQTPADKKKKELLENELDKLLENELGKYDLPEGND